MMNYGVRYRKYIIIINFLIGKQIAFEIFNHKIVCVTHLTEIKLDFTLILILGCEL